MTTANDDLASNLAKCPEPMCTLMGRIGKPLPYREPCSGATVVNPMDTLRSQAAVQELSARLAMATVRPPSCLVDASTSGPSAGGYGDGPGGSAFPCSSLLCIGSRASGGAVNMLRGAGGAVGTLRGPVTNTVRRTPFSCPTQCQPILFGPATVAPFGATAVVVGSGTRSGAGGCGLLGQGGFRF